MDINKVVNYWLKSAERDLRVANGLFKLKHYSYCLFFCHLALEKILKALVVKTTKAHAPLIHDLDVLAKKAGLNLDKEQIRQLEIITTFNIEARYNDQKFAFYKKCTENYTKKYFDISKDLYSWLKKQFPPK